MRKQRIISIVFYLLSAISYNIYGQEFIITGKVVDATTRQELVGISVRQGNFSSAITDKKGFFSLKVVDNRSTLIISGKGYQVNEVALKGRTEELTVELFDEDFNTYYGEILMPLGMRSKSSLTNSVVSVSGLANSSFASVDGKFSGEINGMRTYRRSGTPGIGANMFIRGYNSLNSSCQPLIIVDGMILETNTFSNSLISGHIYNPLSDIDIKDIANISVIKDAVTVYGSKAANGVILIETTHTKDVSTSIDVQMQGGMNFKPENIPMMNASQYKSYLVDQIGSAGIYSDAEVSKLPFLKENATLSEIATYSNNTNWQDEVLKNSFSKDLYFRIKGGDEVAKYGLTIGYRNNEGIISNTFNNRFSSRFNADTYISQKMSFTTNLSVNYQSNIFRDDGMIKRSSPLYLALIKSPMLSPYEADDDGKLTSNYAGIDNMGELSNPRVIIEDATGENKNYKLYGNTKFTYRLSNKLHLSTLLGVNFDKNNDNVFLPEKGIAPGITILGDTTLRSSGVRAERFFSIYNDTRLTYNPNFSNVHNLLLNLGTRYNVNDYENSWSTSENSSDDKFSALQHGNKLNFVTDGSVGSWKWFSVYSNADYSFLNKYFVTVNISMDGSSRFGEKAIDGINLFSTKVGIFPSIGVAWLISSENFMAGKTIIDQLKLRASYGITGNDGIGNYTAQSYFISKRFLEGTGLVSGTLANKEIQWERSKKTNLGIDVGVLNERLALTFDVFRHFIDRLLNVKDVNPVYGYVNYLNNDGELINRGFELGLFSRVINLPSFKWDLGVNISKYKNEIVSLPDGMNIIELPNVNAIVINKVGSPIGLFYGYKTDEIYRSSEEAVSAGLKWVDEKGFQHYFRAGDVKFENSVSTDKIINADDMVVIGDPNPDYTGMISNRFSYKRFSLDAIINFSRGSEIYNSLRSKIESMSDFSNQSQAVNRRWRVENQKTDIPRAEYGDPAGNSRFSDRWIEDGSFLRLKTLSLTYSPTFKSSFIRNASIFITANNLITISKYLGYDPEVSMSEISYMQGIDAGLTPQFKSLFIGLRLGL